MNAGIGNRLKPLEAKSLVRTPPSNLLPGGLGQGQSLVVMGEQPAAMELVEQYL